jgi:hypothetical protein
MRTGILQKDLKELKAKSLIKKAKDWEKEEKEKGAKVKTKFSKRIKKWL